MAASLSCCDGMPRKASRGFALRVRYIGDSAPEHSPALRFADLSVTGERELHAAVLLMRTGVR